MSEPTEPRKDGHTPYHCQRPCTRNGCPYCDGGLLLCTRCGGLEGSLPSQCPGQRMARSTEEAVYAGYLEFRDGVWINAPSGGASNHYDGRPGLPDPGNGSA